MIFDTESGRFEAVENSNAQQAGGAGIESGQFAASKGVKVVLTGNMGPNAFQVLESAGIQVITGASGKVSEVFEKYKNGHFSAAKAPNAASKSGMS